MKTRTKIWIGVGAFVMAGTGLATGHEPQDAKQQLMSSGATLPASMRLAQVQPPAAAATGKADAKQAPAAKPAEGGEGGEGKIDPAAVDSDPIDYGVALQIIAAHYHAGMLAYANGQQEAGTQMFAHGLSEVYVELEDIFKKRGVKGLGDRLNEALDAANAKKPPREVRRRVNAVLAAVEAASKQAPKSKKNPMAVRAEVMAEMLERSAQQYRISANSTDFESYLDGLGFSRAAMAEAKQVMPWVRKHARKAQPRLQSALLLAEKAYPGIKRPKTRTVNGDKFLAAASEAHVLLSEAAK